MKMEKYEVYDIVILGYKCQLYTTRDSGYSVRVPIGKTKKEKEMFDSLVYFHRDVYHGQDYKEVVKKIRNFIKNYK